MNGYGTNERSSKCLKWILPEILMSSFFFIITKLTLRIANRNKLFYNNHLQLLL